MKSDRGAAECTVTAVPCSQSWLALKVGVQYLFCLCCCYISSERADSRCKVKPQISCQQLSVRSQHTSPLPPNMNRILSMYHLPPRSLAVWIIFDNILDVKIQPIQSPTVTAVRILTIINIINWIWFNQTKQCRFEDTLSWAKVISLISNKNTAQYCSVK